MNDEVARMWKESAVVCLKIFLAHYLEICLERLKISTDTQPAYMVSGRDINRASPVSQS
jgi:hypothetical protein